MDIDNMDIDMVRNLLKQTTVKLLKDIETPTETYYASRYYFYDIEDNGDVFIYYKNPTIGVTIENDEILNLLEWG